MASCAVLAGGGLLAFVAVRYLLGARTFAGLIAYPTPVSVPVLVIALPLALGGCGLLLAASAQSIRCARRTLVPLGLTLASWLVLLLLVEALFELWGGFALGARGIDLLLWSWGLLELCVAAWWFGPRSSRAPGHR